MAHWPSYLCTYPSWIDIRAYCTDRCTDVTDCACCRPRRPWAAKWGSAVLPRPACCPCTRCERRFASPPARLRSWGGRTCHSGWHAQRSGCLPERQRRPVAAQGCGQCWDMQPGHTALQADTILSLLQWGGHRQMAFCFLMYQNKNIS
jgi:hypothetical protein